MRNLIRSDAADVRVPIAIPGCKVVGVFLATIARLRQMVACFRRSFRVGGAGRKHKLLQNSLRWFSEEMAGRNCDKTTFTHTAAKVPPDCSLQLTVGRRGSRDYFNILLCIFHRRN